MTVDVPTLQLIAYSALTGASVTVASMSLLLGFRQNFGWKPILIPTEYGYRARDNQLVLTFDFDVWNRRKYPIVLVHEKINFEQVPFEKNQMTNLGDDWHFNDKTHSRTDFWDVTHPIVDLHRAAKHVLEPNAHRQFSLVLPCDPGTDNQWSARATVAVDYFDPIKNKELTLKFGALKWRTSYFGPLVRSGAGRVA